MLLTALRKIGSTAVQDDQGWVKSQVVSPLGRGTTAVAAALLVFGGLRWAAWRVSWPKRFLATVITAPVVYWVSGKLQWGKITRTLPALQAKIQQLQDSQSFNDEEWDGFTSLCDALETRLDQQATVLFSCYVQPRMESWVRADGESSRGSYELQGPIGEGLLEGSRQEVEARLTLLVKHGSALYALLRNEGCVDDNFGSDALVKNLYAVCLVDTSLRRPSLDLTADEMRARIQECPVQKHQKQLKAFITGQVQKRSEGQREGMLDLKHGTWKALLEGCGIPFEGDS